MVRADAEPLRRKWLDMSPSMNHVLVFVLKYYRGMREICSVGCDLR